MIGPETLLIALFVGTTTSMILTLVRAFDDWPEHD